MKIKWRNSGKTNSQVEYKIWFKYDGRYMTYEDLDMDRIGEVVTYCPTQIEDILLLYQDLRHKAGLKEQSILVITLTDGFVMKEFEVEW